MKILRRFRLVCLLIVLISTIGISELFAETLKNEGKEIAQAPVKYHVGKVALIPFTSKEKLSYEQADESINQIERYLTISLYDALVAETVGMPDVELLPLEKSDTEYLKFRSGKPKIYFRDIAIDVGRILDADSVMIGTISEYTERSGSEWAIEAPTTISFSVELLSTKDGQRIWETTFTETQQPLFDNLFEIKKFVKRKGKWITADEMAKEGARKIAQRFSRFVLENR
jgi:hypothetical protein